MGDGMQEISNNIISGHDDNESEEEERLNDGDVDNKSVNNAVDGLFKDVRFKSDTSYIKDEKESTSIPNTMGTMTESNDEELSFDDIKYQEGNKVCKEKKPSKSMSAHFILSSSDKCDDIIVLLVNVYNKFRKHPDINLAINASKEVSNKISTAASHHLGNYAKEVCKRRRIIEKCKSNHMNGIKTDAVENAREKCKMYSKKKEKKEVKKTRHVSQRMASSSIIIDRTVGKEKSSKTTKAKGRRNVHTIRDV
eukprot:9653317-Ditylum_brightwellii.AAC.1